MICVKCERDRPEATTVALGIVTTLDDDGRAWLTILDDDGEMVAEVCPRCQTPDEREQVQGGISAVF